MADNSCFGDSGIFSKLNGGEKVLSMYWKLTIKDKELTLAQKKCITSIDIDEKCDGSDTLTLKVSDPDFVFIDDDLYTKEAKVSFSAGFNEKTEGAVEFNGYISAIDPEFPPDGIPVLSVTCLDGTHQMNRTKKKRTWSNTTSSQVVESIAKEYGYKFETEKDYKFKQENSIAQSETTDIEFIESLAKKEREPWLCKLKDGTVYYKKKGVVEEPVTSLYYKIYPYDIISLSAQINKETKETKVNEANINTSDKSVDSGSATSDMTSYDNGEGATASNETAEGENTANEEAKKETKIMHKWSDESGGHDTVVE